LICWRIIYSPSSHTVLCLPLDSCFTAGDGRARSCTDGKKSGDVRAARKGLTAGPQRAQQRRQEAQGAGRWIHRHGKAVAETMDEPQIKLMFAMPRFHCLACYCPVKPPTFKVTLFFLTSVKMISKISRFFLPLWSDGIKDSIILIAFCVSCI
jgi:hypothetical protein